MVQKVIKIGSSAGVTIPKKQLDELGIHIGDQIEVIFGKPGKLKDELEFYKTMKRIMETYESDFKNLANR